MNKFVIERHIPGAGRMSMADLQAVARKSVGVLADLGAEIQWVESYITGDKIYCVYLASDEELIREHGRGAEGSWTADRALAVSGADGAASLMLAVPEPAESALFLPTPGFYRPLLDAAAPPHPGAAVRDLLGYGDEVGAIDVGVELIDL